MSAGIRLTYHENRYGTVRESVTKPQYFSLHSQLIQTSLCMHQVLYNELMSLKTHLSKRCFNSFVAKVAVSAHKLYPSVSKPLPLTAVASRFVLQIIAKTQTW